MKEQATLDYLAKLLKGTEYEKIAFGAGGLVRDQIMGKPIKDIDIVVAEPDGGIKFAIWLTKKLGIHGPNNPVIYPRFGTAKLTLRRVAYEGHDLSGVDIECVMTRGEQYDPGNRKPEVVYADLKTDAFRRDLTVNSLFKNLVTGEILDLTGHGVEDIKRGVVRTPMDPDETFKDDPLRMLRAVRFAVKYNWNMPMSMIKALKRNHDMLKSISAERIQDEFNKMLMTDRPDKALKILTYAGLMKYIIPELEETVGVGQNEHHKDDVFEHICEVVKLTDPDLTARLASVFHDIGKVKTKTIGDDGRVHFYGHEDESAKIAQREMTRLRYSSKETDSVVNIVANHMRLKGGGSDGSKISDKGLRKFSATMGDDLSSAWKMMHADNQAHATSARMPDQIPALAGREDKLKLPPDKQKLPINGNDIIQALGIKPGPLVKQFIQAIQDKWYEDPTLDKKHALALVRGAYAKMQSEKPETPKGPSDDLLYKKVRNPETEQDILVKTALQYDPNHPARQAAEKLLHKK